MGMNLSADKLVRTIVDLPPLPAVAFRVLALVNDERTTASDLARLLSADQALSAKLLRVANSVEWGFERRITTVREAVVVLGFKQVRQLALVTSVVSNFKKATAPDSLFDADLFWLHNMAVGLAAEVVAKKTRTALPGDAFTAGVLHDLGRLALRDTMPREFEAAISLHNNRGVSVHDAEIRTTGYAHEDIARALGELWSFPGNIVEAIGTHHRLDLTLENDGLSGVISLCDQLVLHYEGLSLDNPIPTPVELARVDEISGGWNAIEAKAETFVKAIAGGLAAAA
jgi:HD-like signal output (HDOD) protein